MNPVILGLYRKQYAEAVLRAQLIRMDIASRTGYLNPQLYSGYLSGLTRGTPSDQESPLLYTVPGYQNASQFLPGPGGLLPIQGLPAVPTAYSIQGTGLPVFPQDALSNLIQMRQAALRAVSSIGSGL